MDLGRSSTDRHKICTQHRGGVKADHLLSIFFSATPKKLARKTYRQTKSYISFRVNALQNGINLRVIIPGVFCNLGRTWANAVNDARKMRILSNSAKFSADRLLLTACSFSGTMASTFSAYRMGALASLKFLAT